jgi:hypothetical protein
MGEEISFSEEIEKKKLNKKKLCSLYLLCSYALLPPAFSFVVVERERLSKFSSL